jgi:hypothetical protein
MNEIICKKCRVSVGKCDCGCSKELIGEIIHYTEVEEERLCGRGVFEHTRHFATVECIGLFHLNYYAPGHNKAEKTTTQKISDE